MALVRRSNREIINYLAARAGIPDGRNRDSLFRRKFGIARTTFSYWMGQGHQIQTEWLLDHCEKYEIDLNEAIYGLSNPLVQSLQKQLDELRQDNIRLHVQVNHLIEERSLVREVRRLIDKFDGSPGKWASTPRVNGHTRHNGVARLRAKGK